MKTLLKSKGSNASPLWQSTVLNYAHAENSTSFSLMSVCLVSCGAAVIFSQILAGSTQPADCGEHGFIQSVVYHGLLATMLF